MRQSCGLLGAANLMNERELVEILRQRPKDVEVLRTKTDFQRFFHGMERSKMKRLLHEAFSHLDPAASSAKIKKRLGLFGAGDDATCD